MDTNSTLFDLSGQVAVVIGGTGNLCGTMGVALARAGAEVILVGRNPENAIDNLAASAFQRAQELAPLGANRANYGGQKERLFGENAILNNSHGAAYHLKHASEHGH